jgi:hypothetical protein
MNPDILLDAAVTRRLAGSRFARRQVLARGLAAGRPSPAVVTALASNDAGDAAAVVAVPVRGRVQVAGYTSQLFLRRAGVPSFRRVRVAIGRQTVGASPAALAVNRAGGGSAHVFGGRMAAAMDAGRRAVVAWVAQRVAGESLFAGPPGIVAAAYAAHGGSFGPAGVLERDLPRGPGRGIRAPGVAVALLRDRAVVAWTGHVANRYAVRAADVTSAGAHVPVDLSPPGADAQLRGMSAGRRGGLVAVWSTRPMGLYAVARAPGAAAWGSVETISPPLGTEGAPAAGLPVAGSPTTGRTIVLWSDPAGPRPAPVPVHVSARPAPG